MGNLSGPGELLDSQQETRRGQIIVISGKQGSGKSSLGRELTRRLKAPTVTHKFAAPLYEIHDAAYRVLKGYGIERDPGVKDGRLLQLLGTDWGRSVLGENVWADACRNLAVIWADIGHNVIIDDCRFDNEFDAFPDAIRVRLSCPRKTRKQRCEAWRKNDKHPSEVGLDDYERAGLFDLTLRTDRLSIAQCAKAVIDYMKAIEG